MKKILSLILAVAMIAGLCVGCAQSATNSTSSAGTKAAGTTGAATTAAAAAYPIVTSPLTLTWYKPLDSNQAGAGIKDLNETLYMQELEKKTGIHIQFQHPAIGQESTQFNLMISSGTLPDLISNGWTGYNGGPEKAISDGIIIDHEKLIEQYAVNFNKFVATHPGAERFYKTDSGKAYCMPTFITLTADGKVHAAPDGRDFYYEAVVGLVLRQDWLTELGLTAPTTIDEWYTVLSAFKTKKQASAPFTCLLSNWKASAAFITAYDIAYGFYEDGSKKAHFGPYEAAYKDFLTIFAKWYKEGLLDADFSTNDQKAVDAKVLDNKSGAWVGFSAGGIGSYIQTAKKTNAAFDLVGVTVPTLQKGATASMGNKSMPYNSTLPTITTANKHQEETIKYLDYTYSEEGDLLVNWGVKGTSYDVVNNQYQFTDKIAKDTAGLTPQQAMQKYIWWGSGDFATRLALYKTYGADAEKRVVEGKALWGKTTRPAGLPPVTIASDKSSEYAKIMSDINTYVDEQFLKFVMGTQALDTFANYQAQLKTMGIDKALQIQQEALDRYYKR